MSSLLTDKSPNYGQMALKLARATKRKISSGLTALRLPGVLVSFLTWSILLSLGALLLGALAFGAIIFAAHSQSQKNNARKTTVDAFDYERMKDQLQDAALGPAFWEDGN